MNEDEIHLVDVARLLARQIKWLLGTLIVVVAGTLLLLFLMRPQWESTAFIRVGQIGQMMHAPDRAIEPVASMVERMRMVPFQNDVLSRIKIGSEDPAARLYRRSIRIEPVPGTDLVQVKVRGRNREEAGQFVQATVDHLRDIHGRMVELALAASRLLLDELTQDLQNAVAEQDRLQQMTLSGNHADAGESTADRALLANAAIGGKVPEIRDLRQRKLELEEELGPLHTYPTALFGEVFVPEEAAFPNKNLGLVLGVAAGLALGLVVAFVRDYLIRTGSARLPGF
jgi:capsular polysaccharide biosynthesis protein